MSDAHDESEQWMSFAKGHVACPVCAEHLPVPVLAIIRTEGDSMTLDTKPDMAELWSHMWAHEAAS